MIVCRSQAEIEKLRRVNHLVAEVLAALREMAVPGSTTEDIDRVVHMSLQLFPVTGARKETQ